MTGLYYTLRVAVNESHGVAWVGMDQPFGPKVLPMCPEWRTRHGPSCRTPGARQPRLQCRYNQGVAYGRFVRMRTMPIDSRVRLILLSSAVIAAVGFAGAQQPAIPVAVQRATLEQVVPVDPLITVGTLPNGFRYYIRENRQPQARAELRLVVNAGSVLEDEDQRGLAHFVEHMAFNGTLHFPRAEVGGFMQSLGMRFGAHVNAHTSFDETVYQLQIPTGNPAVIDRSLIILEDWAQHVSFDSTEIDKERGVSSAGSTRRVSNSSARPRSRAMCGNGDCCLRAPRNVAWAAAASTRV